MRFHISRISSLLVSEPLPQLLPPPPLSGPSLVAPEYTPVSHRATDSPGVACSAAWGEAGCLVQAGFLAERVTWMTIET